MTALPELDQRDSPDGYERRWEPVRDSNGYSGDWRVVTELTGKLYRCRWGSGPGHSACGAPSVAKLNRGHERERWWHYCGEHMYGQVLVDGIIYQPVLREISDEARA